MSLLFVYELICFGRVTQAEWEKITEKMHKRYKDIHDYAFSIIDGFSSFHLIFSLVWELKAAASREFKMKTVNHQSAVLSRLWTSAEGRRLLETRLDRWNTSLSHNWQFFSRSRQRRGDIFICLIIDATIFLRLPRLNCLQFQNPLPEKLRSSD